MSIHELLAQVPADKLQVQFFHQGDIDAQHTKSGTRISFYTGTITPTQIMNNSGPIGLVVWIPRDEWREIVQRNQRNKLNRIEKKLEEEKDL